MPRPQNTWGGTEPVRPLIYTKLSHDDLTAWFQNERPDVVISAGEGDCRAIAQVLKLEMPGSVGLVAANLGRAASGFAGIDEQPDLIGATAVDLLHAKVVSGVRGIPSSPTLTLIQGRWRAGAGFPPG